ncbi:putative P450 monooxygenase [Pseudovirgaria hyperparasitica]|uniref:Putative P450 monooxygenase n=1 Tax=Pseudovirgaria hyperparasitica TaxID=470096 RepID=A0A6A6VTK9_9PEZI|nr:putative P450 monooxygenase [Pseudovirgaria hyperparasitica]KAF2753912.1 putative P450 monooxygenase [Pseudovirgaria hyperparasitica]
MALLPPSFVAALVSGLLVLWYVYSTLNAYLALRHFKGPWSSGFSRLWLLRANLGGRMNHEFRAVNDKYGKTARVGPQTLLTTDVALIKRMNGTRSDYRRSVWYNALRLHPTRDNITSHRDEQVHSRLRAQMTQGYSGKDVPDLEKDIDRCIEDFFALINRTYVSSEAEYVPFDLARLATFFSLDVISTVAFGKSFGFLDLNDDPFGYLPQLQTLLPAIIFFGVYPEIQKIMRLSWMQALLPKATDVNGVGRVMGFAKDVVAERFGEEKVVRRDMLGSFLKNGLTQDQLESETLTQVAAGSDSTATVIRMAIFLIASNPSVYNKVLEELDVAEAAGKLTRPVIRDSESRLLPYFQACVRETLRCYPPVTGQLAKQSPANGDHFNGMYIPPNTQIAWNSWGLMRTKEIFGDDVDVFRPERWLASGGHTPEELAHMEETVWMAFGWGRFGCLGRPVAQMEINKTIPELLMEYNFQIADPSNPFSVKCVGFFIHTDMFFRVSKRIRRESRTAT